MNEASSHADNGVPVSASIDTPPINVSIKAPPINTTPPTTPPKKRKDPKCQKQNRKKPTLPNTKTKPLERLAKRGTLKFREQMRQLVEERDADQAVDKTALFEDNVSALETNPFLSIADPNVQSTPRNNSLDVLSLSFVAPKREIET